MGRAGVVVVRGKGCWNHSLHVCASDSTGTLVYLFSLADLIFIMSVHPLYWLVRGNPNWIYFWPEKCGCVQPTQRPQIQMLSLFWWKYSLLLSATGQNYVSLPRLEVIVGGGIFNIAHLAPQSGLIGPWGKVDSPLLAPAGDADLHCPQVEVVKLAFLSPSSCCGPGAPWITEPQWPCWHLQIPLNLGLIVQPIPGQGHPLLIFSCKVP